MYADVRKNSSGAIFYSTMLVTINRTRMGNHAYLYEISKWDVENRNSRLMSLHFEYKSNVPLSERNNLKIECYLIRIRDI